MTEDDMLKLARECAAKNAIRFYETYEQADIHQAYQVGRFDDGDGVQSALAAILIMHERGEKLAGAAALTEWKGEGPPPKKWIADNGTIVYRSYEDYCDD